MKHKADNNAEYGGTVCCTSYIKGTNGRVGGGKLR